MNTLANSPHIQTRFQWAIPFFFTFLALFSLLTAYLLVRFRLLAWPTWLLMSLYQPASPAEAHLTCFALSMLFFSLSLPLSLACWLGCRPCSLPPQPFLSSLAYKSWYFLLSPFLPLFAGNVVPSRILFNIFPVFISVFSSSSLPLFSQLVLFFFPQRRKICRQIRERVWEIEGEGKRERESKRGGRGWQGVLPFRDYYVTDDIFNIIA